MHTCMHAYVRTDRQTNKQIERNMYIQRQTDRQTDRQTRQAGKQAGRQTDRGQTDRQTEKRATRNRHMYILRYPCDIRICTQCVHTRACMTLSQVQSDILGVEHVPGCKMPACINIDKKFVVVVDKVTLLNTAVRYNCRGGEESYFVAASYPRYQVSNGRSLIHMRAASVLHMLSKWFPQGLPTHATHQPTHPPIRQSIIAHHPRPTSTNSQTT